MTRRNGRPELTLTSRWFMQEALGKPVAITEFGKRDHGGSDNQKRAQMLATVFGQVQSSLATHGSFAGSNFWMLVSQDRFRSPSGGTSWSTCPYAVCVPL
jgi:hypothetical protein